MCDGLQQLGECGCIDSCVFGWVTRVFDGMNEYAQLHKPEHG